MLWSADVILFCGCNYHLYIFNRHLRRFPRHLKILPSPAFTRHSPGRGDGGRSAALILKAQIENQKEKKKERQDEKLFVLSALIPLAFAEKAREKRIAGRKRKTVDTKAEIYT